MNFEFGEATCIFYLFNPFDAEIILKFLNKIESKNCFVIYNNPVHKKLFSGFKQIHEERGWHPNLDFIIYRSFK